MIAVPAGVRVLAAAKPVDFRKGADGLVALVSEALGQDSFCGTIFIFRSKRADRLKILAWDRADPGQIESGRLLCAPCEREYALLPACRSTPSQ